MRLYEKAPVVDQDLERIVIYTYERWGEAQVRKYMMALERCMETLASGAGPHKSHDSLLPGLKVQRCQQHYIFGVVRPDEPMLILAVLHERMDMLKRLKSRLALD
jgi:plasmid stabilization system protein ParE